MVNVGWGRVSGVVEFGACRGENVGGGGLMGWLCLVGWVVGGVVFAWLGGVVGCRG